MKQRIISHFLLLSLLPCQLEVWACTDATRRKPGRNHWDLGIGRMQLKLLCYPLQQGLQRKKKGVGTLA